MSPLTLDSNRVRLRLSLDFDSRDVAVISMIKRLVHVYDAVVSKCKPRAFYVTLTKGTENKQQRFTTLHARSNIGNNGNKALVVVPKVVTPTAIVEREMPIGGEQ